MWSDRPESSNLSLLLRSQRCCDIVRLSLLNYLVKVGSKPGDEGGLSPLFRQVILDDADHVILDEAQIQSLQFELSNVLKDKLLRHQMIRTRKSLPSQRVSKPFFRNINSALSLSFHSSLLQRKALMC